MDFYRNDIMQNQFGRDLKAQFKNTKSPTSISLVVLQPYLCYSSGDRPHCNSAPAKQHFLSRFEAVLLVQLSKQIILTLQFVYPYTHTVQIYLCCPPVCRVILTPLSQRYVLMKGKMGECLM